MPQKPTPTTSVLYRRCILCDWLRPYREVLVVLGSLGLYWVFGHG